MSFLRRTRPPLFLALPENTARRAHRINIYGGGAWKGDALIILFCVPVFLIFEKSKALCSGRIFLTLVA